MAEPGPVVEKLDLNMTAKILKPNMTEGTAIKARAKSVLGTLWPVDDETAKSVMQYFYRGLATSKLSKSEALRQAQIELIQNPDMNHPFFWAPFILIGNWL
jgi:CHAT domain-containing protein